MSKILVADDEPLLLQIIAEALIDEGYEVISARDGQEAVDLTIQERPDLLILDVMMPRLDGREAIRILRQRNSPPHIPMVLMSAGVAASRIDPDITFLQKPFDLERLLLLVERLLDRKAG